MVSALLTADARRVVAEQRLAFVATVCPDGTPNVWPRDECRRPLLQDQPSPAEPPAAQRRSPSSTLAAPRCSSDQSKPSASAR
jgi:predicted pyridoxine 5'-phosphate oxidase superfamily flavin-nucleotide-binding protein